MPGSKFWVVVLIACVQTCSACSRVIHADLRGNTSSSGQIPPYPVVFTPGFMASILNFSVTGQLVAECPQSASFGLYYGFDQDTTDITPICAYKFARVNRSHYARDGDDVPEAEVSVQGPRWGYPDCWHPLHNQVLHPALQQAGYSAGENFFAACWDFRLTPDIPSDFYPPANSTGRLRSSWVNATASSIEKLYDENQERGVILVGYSNGALYNNYLASTMPQDWVKKYIAGVVSVAGNVAGVEAILGWLVTGSVPWQNNTGGPEMAEVLRSWPILHASLPAEDVFADEPLVEVEATGVNYTAEEFPQLMADLNLTGNPPEYHHLGRRFVGPSNVPCVPLVALVADTPLSTVGSVVVGRDGEGRPGRMVGGDDSVSSTHTAVWSALEHQRAHQGGRCSCAVRVIDVGQFLGPPEFNHLSFINDSRAVDYLVEEVLLKWDEVIDRKCRT